MTQFLLTAAGAIILLMGTGHLLLTLRDVWRPKAFTPTDDAVRQAMKESNVKFDKRLNLWDAWLGFNISHSMGAMMFGGVLLFTARAHLEAFLQSAFLQTMAVLVAVVYLVVAIRFWFRGPVIGISIVLLCILAAIIQR